MIDDPLLKAIYSAIKPGIDVTFHANLFGPALILIYSGIDTMAWLNMPSDQLDVSRQDFIGWVESYFPKDFTAKITGVELHSARCAVVHSYGVESALTRSGQDIRTVLYKAMGQPAVKFEPSIHPAYVIVELEHLKNCFYGAIDTFLMKSFADKTKANIIEQRAEKLLNNIPV